MKLKLLLVVFSFFLRSTMDPLPPLVSWSRFFRNWIKISELRFNILANSYWDYLPSIRIGLLQFLCARWVAFVIWLGQILLAFVIFKTD